MLLQIHDELLFEIREDFLEKTIIKIKDIMENVVKLKVPLVVNINISSRWGEKEN
jgi:DNA polymerase-1